MCSVLPPLQVPTQRIDSCPPGFGSTVPGLMSVLSDDVLLQELGRREHFAASKARVQAASRYWRSASSRWSREG